MWTKVLAWQIDYKEYLKSVIVDGSLTRITRRKRRRMKRDLTKVIHFFIKAEDKGNQLKKF